MLNRVSTALLLLLSSAPAFSQEACELHIFPTDDVVLATKLWPNGLAADLLAGAAPPKGVILRELPAGLQIEAARQALNGDPRLAAYALVPEEKRIDYKSAVKIKTRLVDSGKACHAELVLVNIVFSDTGLTHKKIGVMSVLREFDPPTGKLKLTKLGGAARLEIFPPQDGTLTKAATDDLANGFREAFAQSVAKFLKPDR